jgi:hypothetical protein
VSSRRVVRVAPSFFDRLDQLFPEERSGDGAPSATDFLLHDLPNIIDALASNFIGRTAPLQGREPIRVYLTGSILVSFAAIYAAESADSSVDLLWIDIDRSE